jgi:hypothetical protein
MPPFFQVQQQHSTTEDSSNVAINKRAIMVVFVLPSKPPVLAFSMKPLLVASLMMH